MSWRDLVRETLDETSGSQTHGAAKSDTMVAKSADSRHAGPIVAELESAADDVGSGAA